MIKLTEPEFRNLIKKYWEAGMNNMFFHHMKDMIQTDVNKYSFRRDIK
jgi:hypothetical protein